YGGAALGTDRPGARSLACDKQDTAQAGGRVTKTRPLAHRHDDTVNRAATCRLSFRRFLVWRYGSLRLTLSQRRAQDSGSPTISWVVSGLAIRSASGLPRLKSGE